MIAEKLVPDASCYPQPLGNFDGYVVVDSLVGACGIGGKSSHGTDVGRDGEKELVDSFGLAEAVGPKTIIVARGRCGSLALFTMMDIVARPGSEKPIDENDVCLPILRFNCCRGLRRRRRCISPVRWRVHCGQPSGQ